MMSDKEFSNFDYENLTEIYFKNPWLTYGANYQGFEVLWDDYKLNKQKLTIKKLINHFTYIQLEQAEQDIKDELSIITRDWKILPENTIFVAFSKHKYADGSQLFLNFLKPRLFELNDDWNEGNLYSRINYGIERIKAGGNKEFNIVLKNIVLVDDFIGTGGTAVKAVRKIMTEIQSSPLELNLFVFALGSMSSGLRHLYKETFVSYRSCYVQKKGTDLGFPKKERKQARKFIYRMEGILSKGNSSMSLADHRLGYGKSEALYSFNRFNIPNNNYPIFWWNRYRDNKFRKALFSRMQ